MCRGEFKEIKIIDGKKVAVFKCDVCGKEVEVFGVKHGECVVKKNTYKENTMKIELGSKVKEIVTGFEGIVTGFCTYITGCDQYLVQPVHKEENQCPKAIWFGVDRLEVLDTEPIKLKKERKPERGCDKPAPIK